MIEAFQGFGGTTAPNQKPAMSLISGSTRIFFDGRYQLAPVYTANGEYRHVIAFNNKNDIEQQPDERNVHTIRNFFPGTVINFKFFIDRHYLETTDER